VYEDAVKLLEMPEYDSVSVCVYIENEGLFELGERINARFEEAYMNGYNWDALIRCYVGHADPDLIEKVEPDPEAGMCAARMRHSPENLELMRRFESHIRAMIADEDALIHFIETNRDAIEWD
jgi:hypothetical protein